MDIKEKKDAIITYCGSRKLCNECEGFDYRCPLWDTPEASCFSNPDYIGAHYKQLVEAGCIKDVDEPINVKEIMEEKVIKHDGCFACEFEYMGAEDYPCDRCNGTAIPGTPEYESRPDLFEPKRPKEPTEDIINHPNHYTNGGMECIDEMLMVFGKETVAHFCLCNAWKYRYRALSKNGQEDIDKSHWYMAKYKQLKEESIWEGDLYDWEGK